MKENSKQSRWLIALSLLLNVFLIASIIFIGYIKTDFIKRQFVKLGISKIESTKRTDYWCIRGWTNTLDKLNLNVDVVFFGNSITAGSSFHDFFTDKSICNLGYPGDNLTGMMARVQQIQIVKPEKVFVMGGINGLKQMPLNIFETQYRELIVAIKDTVPTAEIYLQSILPVSNAHSRAASNKKISDCNLIIRDIAKSLGCKYIDLYSLYTKNDEINPDYSRDGVHIKEEHYDKWIEAIRPFIYDSLSLLSGKTFGIDKKI